MLSNEPVTKIDPRFSDPDAVATGWDETLQVLETAELFWISTVQPTVAPTSLRWLPCGSMGPSTSPPAPLNRRP